ncbi:hypothetical protein [Citrobacter sedlakii]|uniref:hypothetical protein n=1 Tax=Citrobacter sedlakii TaxID=67826 RepID=UPI003334F738
MTIDKQALAIPQREKHDWSQAVMRDCEFCQQWALTVKHSDGGCICASCCDSEYTTALSSALVVALDELEAKDKQIAELVAGLQNLQRTMGVYVHAYEEAKGQVAKDVQIKARLCIESNSLFDRLRAAEKRNAELTEFLTHIKKCLVKNREYAPVSHEEIDTLLGIRAAGIGKGE